VTAGSPAAAVGASQRGRKQGERLERRVLGSSFVVIKFVFSAVVTRSKTSQTFDTLGERPLDLTSRKIEMSLEQILGI
jgi:hypothetical protein